MEDHALNTPPSLEDNLKDRSLVDESNRVQSSAFECRLAIALPTPGMALELQAILEVDQEISPLTTKLMEVVSLKEEDGSYHHQLVVTIRAKHLKGLRVAISSFLDYIQVALKCYQEFA
jgi:tRNA threonylcarbamoyladenosine modification (KEOPS) complex  Pcc1 subunit